MFCGNIMVCKIFGSYLNYTSTVSERNRMVSNYQMAHHSHGNEVNIFPPIKDDMTKTDENINQGMAKL